MTLINTITWVFVTYTLLTTLVTVSRIGLLISKRTITDIQCYAISDRIAHNLLTLLEKGQGVVSSKTILLRGVEVVVKTQPVNNQQYVQVESISGSVSDTISFTYDTMQHSILTWQDNGPGIVE